MDDNYMDILQKYKQENGLKILNEYLEKVWAFLNGMKTGSKVLIDNIATNETKELFIASVKLYITETSFCSVVFTNDFKTIKKHA